MDYLKDKKKFNALAKDVFDAIDENQNGYIEFQEMKRAVLEMYQNVDVKQMTDKQLDDMISQFDQDENQTLSQNELATFLRQVLEKSVKLQKEEEEKKKQKKDDKNESTTFRSKKITTRERELQKQELNQLKQELKNLKTQDKKSQPLQNQKLVNFYVNPTARDEEVKEKQQMFDASSNNLSNNLSITSSLSSKSNKSLNPLVINQYLRQGFVKSAEDIIQMSQNSKTNHLIGMAVKRISAGEWQGLIDYFNEQTDKEFDRTPSSQQFHIISNKLSKNVKFLLIHIQGLKFNNAKDLRINDISDLQKALFFWEIKYNEQTYFKNSAKEFPNQKNECLDSILIYNYTDPIEVIFWKKQGKDSIYVGQFDITPNIFQLMRRVVDEPIKGELENEETKYKLNLNKINKSLRRLEVPEVKLYRKKRINYSKNYQEDPPLIGDITVKFQMFEIFEYDAPQNQLSNVIGSPRSLTERQRRNLVEQSKYGSYKWPDDQQNKALVVSINEASIELAIVNEEDVQSFLDGQLGALIKETFYFNTEGSGSRKTIRAKRPQLSENTLALLKSLDEHPLVVQVNILRQTIRQGRLPKKVLEEALIQFGCSGSQLFIDHIDDMGMCEYDYCLDDANYSLIIDTIQDMGFSNPENIQQADSFAEKLISNIKSVLIEGKRVEPLFEFLKVAEKIPDFAITINLISDQFQHGLGSKTNKDNNIEIDPGSFISYFDINSRDFEKMENYEHIMVLGKLVRLAKKHLKKDDPFLNHIQSNYEEAKTRIYFTVPVLPKKKKLKEKAKLLILQSDNVSIDLLGDIGIDKNASLSEIKQKFIEKKKQIQKDEENVQSEEDQVPELKKPCLWNICHELVRRQRWKMFYEGFEAAPEFYYQQGGTGNTPLMDFFEKAPFSVINQTIIQYHPNNPNEDNKEIPKLDPQKIFDMTTSKGKSFIHALALNNDPNPQGQILAMKSILGLFEQDQQDQLLVNPMKPHDATPLVLYINKLSNFYQIRQEEESSVKEILRILKTPLKKDFNQSLFRAKCFFKVYNIGLEEDDVNDYYYNHTQLSKAMAQLQPAIFKLVIEEIDWISWFSLNIENNNFLNQEISFAIYNLARQGKTEYLEQTLDDLKKTQNSLICLINPDQDFIISQNQNQEEFISNENNQITIFNQDQTKTIKFDQDEMLKALAQFYIKYPLEALIGIQKILNEQQFTSPQLKKLLKEIIQQTIKMEPRILAKQFYMKQKAPYTDLEKLGMEEDIKKILNPDQIQAFKEKSSNFAKNFFEDGLSGALKNKEDALKLDYESQKEFFKYTSKLMTEKGLDDLLKFINKLESDKIDGREEITNKLLNQIVRSLPNNFAKNQYPKIFKTLRQNKNNSSQEQEKNKFYQKNKEKFDLIDQAKKINNYQMKQVLNAALYSNNQQLINNCLLHLWNKSHQNVKLRIQSVLRPLYQKYGQYYRALSQHPAVVLNQQDFNKYMDDTKDVATLEDFEIAAKALVKLGLPERLPIFLKKLAAKKPELIFNLLEDIALNLLEKELLSTPVNPIKPIEGQIPKVQPQFIIPTKRQIILSQYNLFDAGAMGCLLSNAKKLLEKSANLPKSWDTYNHNLNKQAFQQQYQQKLRQNFFTQNPGTMFNNWSNPNSDIQKTVETILEALQDSLDTLLSKKPDLKDKLEKISLLPLISNNISIIDKLNKKEERIFTAIENIILQNLKQKASNLELKRIEKRIKGNLQFLEQNFTPNLKTVMETEKKRSLRILRALDYTLKKEQQQLQIQFATDVVLIIVKNFVPDDFSGIIDTNSEQIFNALAVALMRCKSIDPKALEFMGSQLNKYQFYDLVSSLELGEQQEQQEQQKQQEQKKNQIKIKESRIFRSIEAYPQKTEIELAERLVVPSQNNIPYFIKLLKAKVKPFFKTYTKEKNFVDGKAFGLNDLKNLSLFEYLIVKCHYTLISKHYINVFKPKNPLQEDQVIKYLCLASSCGSYTLFDLITEQILNLKFPQLYKDYEKFPQFQIYLNQPVFYQVLMYASEQSSTMFFENIIVDGVTLDSFYRWMKFNIEEDEDTQNISNYNCFVPIILKKYGQLLYLIIQFLRKIIKKDQDYYANLGQIMNNRNFSESIISDPDDENENERLSLLEFSIYQGFPDFCMLFEKNIKLYRNPLEGKIYQILQVRIGKCSAELQQEDSVLINYCKKYEKDQKNYRVSHYQVYLVSKKYFQSDKKKLESLQSSVMLFKIMLQYKPQICLLLNVRNGQDLIEEIDNLSIEKQLFYEQFFYLHMIGFDKILKYQLSISDYVRQFHSKQKLFWVQLDVIEAFKTYFKFDFKKELRMMNQFDPEQISSKLDQFTSEVMLYIVYNQPKIFEIEQERPLKEFFFNKYMLPIIRHLSTQDIIQPIDSKGIKKKELEEMIEKQQSYYDNIMKQLLIEDVELNYQYAAILVFYISTCNDQINYLGEGDTSTYKINPILLQQLEKLSIKDLDCYIISLIQQMRNNELYEIAIQWTQQSKASINKDIFKEKSFIQGLINFINKKKKSDNFNFNYQLNDFLKLFQFEFVRTDKLFKDKIYRGLCVLHIALNFISEMESIKDYVNPSDSMSINIELMEQSKAKNSQLKELSVKEIYEDEVLIGFNYQLEMPMIYQERNNIINLFFNQNTIKEFQELQEKKRFYNFQINEFQEELRQSQFILNLYQVSIAIKPKELQYDNIKFISQELKKKYPFQFGTQFSELVHEIDLDKDIFFSDNNSKISQRKQLTIDDEISVQSYFDAKTYEYNITLNILIMKKDQFFSKCSREAQIKFLIDDFQRKQNQLKYIQKFQNTDGHNINEYKVMLELIEEEKNRKKQKTQLDEEEQDLLQNYKEKYKNFQTPPYFAYELDWPIYIDQNQVDIENSKVYADEYNLPQFLFKKLIQIIDGVFSEMVLAENDNRKSSIKTILKRDQSYLINYISFIDTLVLQFTKMFELTKKSKLMSLNLEDIAYQALDWPFLKYIMNIIKNKIGKSNLLFEMKESSKPDISMTLPGMDDCVQLSQTNYFLYKGMFIIRLGVFYNKKVLKLERSDNQNLRYSQNFPLNYNLEPYVNYIINETQLQTVLKKEQEQQN
ncbi:unnamed protein product [Paramecium sonneborni]|uniref:EF-hand domain-containing protein n=1 Tax=Paramecium sonneborni TaxID=65129 RepID=A0A8S1R0D9_9CILI|nr:unnamed protein product [Paramecium sonneborni]